MLLNRVETALMNNPVRAAVQRHFEARRLLDMGGGLRGGRALEIGCGRGVGTVLILEVFGASAVDAFDLDPRMVAQARARLRGSPARLWVGDATAINVPEATYDAVFDFGIVHHVQDWRRAVAEVHRVLKPGGRLYAEEVLRPAITMTRWILEHPRTDRFDAAGFGRELQAAGLDLVATRKLGPWFAWFVARKPAMASEQEDRGLIDADRGEMGGTGLGAKPLTQDLVAPATAGEVTRQ